MNIEELKNIFEINFPNDRINGTLHCPYRVCPLGSHIDHQHGIVSGFALDVGVDLVYSKQYEPIVEIYSVNYFNNSIKFAICNDFFIHNNWGDYARASMKVLLDNGYTLKYGFNAVLNGNLPIGGLSSSAAVILLYITAFCKVNDITLEKDKLINLAYSAERDYIGLNVGKLDQSCEVLCEKDHLLYLDTANNGYKNIIKNELAPQFKIAILFSGVSRQLVNSKYNTRVDECRSAAYTLKAFGNLDYGKIKDTYLRDVPYEVYEEYKDKLPKDFAKRAEHFYSEMQRIKDGVFAWENGDLNTFGQKIFESGNSSIYNYECGSDELKTLYEIMVDTPNIYGGRFSGAGFKGCCMAIVNPKHTEEIEEYVTKRYLDKFPNLKENFSIHFCDTSDGIKF
jgi:galactokinase/galacturonokinase